MLAVSPPSDSECLLIQLCSAAPQLMLVVRERPRVKGAQYETARCGSYATRRTCIAFKRRYV